MTSIAQRGGAGSVTGVRPTLPSLTGLRFCAALLVFLTHATLLSNPMFPAAPVSFYSDPTVARVLAVIFAPAGYVGVSFFFVLSGFVITWSTREGTPARSFWRRRLLKIYPNHVVTWIIVMALFARLYTPTHAWLTNLFLVHAFDWQADTFNSVNGPSWSLCAELLFYLLFPLLVRPIKRIAEHRLWWWVAGAVVGVAVVALVTVFLVPAGPTYPLTPLPLTKLWFGYAFPVPRLFEFVIGMLLARIVGAGRWPLIGLRWVVTLVVVGYAGAVLLPAPFDFSLATVVPIAAVIGTAATADLRGAHTVLNSRVAIWLGTVSFGFYMIQSVPIFFGRLVVFGGDTYNDVVATVLLCLLFGVTLLLGWLLYRLVEAPIVRRWSHRGTAARRDRQPDRPAPILS